jgi:hypothetical protein
MPLNFVNEERTHAITVCDTTFHLISMTIEDREALIFAIANLDVQENTAGKSYLTLLDLICPVIKSIDGYDEEPKAVLRRLEDYKQAMELVKAVVAHCNLGDDESKN